MKTFGFQKNRTLILMPKENTHSITKNLSFMITLLLTDSLTNNAKQDYQYPQTHALNQT